LLWVFGDVLFSVVTWHIYAMVPAFLPLLEAPLELTSRYCKGGSAIVCGFLGHPGDIVLTAVVSVLETRRNHKDANQASTEGGD